jgi:hypothetical protein
LALISYILIVALFSFGWSNLFNEGMIFERVGKWLDARLPEWLAKPLYACPICNSVWVAITMAVVGVIPYNPWWFVPVVALGASGLASIVTGVQNKLKDIADVIEEQTEAMNEIVNMPEDDEL